ncbi:hypothetical protein [Massilia sp. 9096]|uniref:hypothetical protein n=1 Tax=Massilia sp. 9096 TaxID=1500894 RepID=UPI0012E07C1B|nr:hypothetical protein [Massilia sp. 9096]
MNKLGAYQRKAQNIENVKARHDLLVTGLKSPEKISQSVAKTMGGQRTFCALTLHGSKIKPLSLNTLKSLTRELYSRDGDKKVDGFHYFDDLRTSLKTLLEGTQRGRSAEAKASRQNEHKEELEGRLQAVERQNIFRSKAYLDLFGKVNAFIKVATIDDATRLRLFNLLEDHHILYGSLFASPSENSGGDSAVLLAWPRNREK